MHSAEVLAAEGKDRGIMAQKHYKCPYCGSTTVIEEATWDEQLGEKLPVNLLKATLITLAGIPTGGIGSVVLGGIFYGESVVKYFNGTKVTCGNPNCKRDFSV